MSEVSHLRITPRIHAHIGETPNENKRIKTNANLNFDGEDWSLFEVNIRVEFSPLTPHWSDLVKDLVKP